MPQFDVARVRRYYDRNTAAFVRHGQGRDEGAIHRAVWGPGVRDRRDAFHYVDDRIGEVIRSLPVERPHVVDLGCGVGASLCHLAQRLPIRGTGVTLSPAQAELATRRIAGLGLAERVTCVEGDYTDLPPAVDAADAAFAIESFLHCPDPARFFAEAARIVRRGGALVVCDDMRGAPGGRAAERAVVRFARGWHVNALLTPDGLRAAAEAAGFRHASTERLTPYLELRRPRDRAIAALVAPLRLVGWHSPRLDPLIGGDALQTCLAHGWVEYDLAVFRRV